MRHHKGIANFLWLLAASLALWGCGGSTGGAETTDDGSASETAQPFHGTVTVFAGEFTQIDGSWSRCGTSVHRAGVNVRLRDQDQSVIATTSLENVGGADFGWLTEMHDGLDAFDIHIPSDANDEEIDATWREYLDDSDDYMCVLAFTFEDIPSADFYELQIGSALSSFGFSRDELEADGYFLPLVVD